MGLASGWAQSPGQEPEATTAAAKQGEAVGEGGSELSDAEQKQIQSRTGTTYRNWEELVADWLTPRPVPKSVVIRIDEKHAYPHAAVAFKMEIVKETDDTVWLRGLPPENPESAIHDMWLRRENQELVVSANRNWEEKYGVVDFYLDFSAEIVPPPFMDSLTFESSSDGLRHAVCGR